jgi:hypothetical protein
MGDHVQANRPSRKEKDSEGVVAWEFTGGPSPFSFTENGTDPILFTPAWSEVDCVGSAPPCGFTYLDSYALRASVRALCGLGGPSS